MSLIVFNISGKAESGKNEVCRIIKEHYESKEIKVCEMLFAKHIKQYAKDYFGWDGEEETKPRDLLQKIGTNLIRDKMNNPNFHANRLIEDVNILSNYFEIFVISDCRFPNEVGLVRQAFQDNVITIRINRPNHISELTQEQLNHQSEAALDNYNHWDFVINNNGNIEQLKSKLDNMITEEGAIKYGVRNWEDGMPFNRYNVECYRDYSSS